MISGLRINFDDLCLAVGRRLGVDHRLVRGAVLLVVFGVICALANFPAPAIPFCIGAFFLLRRPRSRGVGVTQPNASQPWAEMAATPPPPGAAAPVTASARPATGGNTAPAPRFTVAAVAARFAALDGRVKRMEAAVMSDDLSLRRQFRDLGA